MKSKFRKSISARIRTLRISAKKFGYAAPKMTIDQIINAINDSDNKCDSCKEELDKRYCIDHCHDTGKFRGILCYRCNTIEGFALTAERCESVASYIRKHQK